ncbi:MAG: transcription-repair coupling factor, partial [Lentisphaeria bacterium]|nr:transcription-repair coupling factor [Lentisphaeria bacterium]
PITVLRVLAAFAGRVLVVTADSQRAETVCAFLRAWLPVAGDSRRLVEIPEVIATHRGRWIPENEAARCAALAAALDESPSVFVATVEGLLAPALAPAGFARSAFVLKRGQEGVDPDALAARLVALDYDNEFEVHAPGEFSRRGGILDVYSPLYEAPVRIEFFADEIASMRFFLPDSQRSYAETEELRVVPRGAMVAEAAGEDEALLWDYFREVTSVVACGPAAIDVHLTRFGSPEQAAAWEGLRTQARRWVELITDVGEEEPRNGAPVLPAESVSLAGEVGNIPPELADQAGIWRWQQLRDSLRRWHGQGHAVVACCAGEGEATRFRQMLAEDPQTAAIPVEVEHIPLDCGLLLCEAGIVLLSEQQLFGRRADVRRRQRTRYRCDLALHEDVELEEGAYAVHASHGICRYHGILEMEVSGEIQEVLDLEFDDDARLYVPLDQAFLVSRYVGGTRHTPRLSRLGASAWRNAKAGAGAAAWDLAAEIFRLEALRQGTRGVAFEPATEWESTFAGAFPYSETEDQAAAIEDVLGDMARPEPMDRLLCGDVGYGKTEVAMRAAFRAVLNGRQVAVLVPTTVLAQQHYTRFRERMAEYPVSIEMLSRFRSRGEQQHILQRVAEARVDILIGTHRLLQPDVRFADLGLLVIDEEQRFGVRHKQRLKQMRASVDILTMTATPIPRTLYYSLSGLRRLSTIMTAPAERLPVTTVIAQYDRELIREVITRELERQGQVYFLHNRVQTIDRTAAGVRQLVPDARTAVAHGQMTPHELERVMSRFLCGEVDVLVCTTIIESGIDIPNANTIVIDRADRFGLAELYQLRGRVGRYHRQAYAYLLLPPMGTLPENAKQRLRAIRRYTHLGAGFKLALRDLEIRGAGNILGPEQSGHIAAVGFELYNQLLRQAVAQLARQPSPVHTPVPVELDTVCFSLRDGRGRTPAAIPASYVGEECIRVACYRRLAALATPADLDAFSAELRDRFGPPPACVDMLLAVTRVRLLARAAGLHRVTVRRGRVSMENERGLVRDRAGHLPELSATDAAGQLAELTRWIRDRTEA